MTTWRSFDYKEKDGVATLTFARPKRLNSLTFEVYRELRDVTAELKSRSDVRVLVITGTGRGFCSGGDVDEIIGELVKSDTQTVYEFAEMTGACVRNLREMRQTVIAAVNGVAAGAGAVIAAASDIRVLAASASFRFLFTSVGLSGGDMGICWLLPRIVGLGRATEILLLGEKIEAEEAAVIGLANKVVPDNQLGSVVKDYASRLLAVSSLGRAMTKEVLNRSAALDYSAAIEMEAWTQTLLMTSKDFREFYAAFTGKRKPIFKGR